MDINMATFTAPFNIYVGMYIPSPGALLTCALQGGESLHTGGNDLSTILNSQEKE
jgi:hypothetical protein